VKVEKQVGEPDGGREVVEDVPEAESNLHPKIQRIWICHFQLELFLYNDRAKMLRLNNNCFSLFEWLLVVNVVLMRLSDKIICQVSSARCYKHFKISLFHKNCEKLKLIDFLTFAFASVSTFVYFFT
jgi:hypothetical protein